MLSSISLIYVPSLEFRRFHTDQFWCYKIMFGLVRVDLDDSVTGVQLMYTNAHGYKKLFQHRTILTTVRHNFLLSVYS